MSLEVYRGMSGLLAHWQLEESGATATRVESLAGGAGYDLTTVTGLNATAVAGQIGNCGEWSGGSGKAAQLSPNAALLVLGDCSVSLWLYQDTTTAAQVLFYIGGRTGSELEADNTLLRINTAATTNRLQVLWEAGAGTDYNHNFTTALTTLRWTHLVVTRDSSKVHVYLDGALRESLGWVALPTGGGSSVVAIGAQYTTAPSTFGAAWDGKIDDVAYFSRALTALEVRRIFYRGMVTPTAADLTSEEAKVGYYARIEGIPYYLGCGIDPQWNLGSGQSWVGCMMDPPGAVAHRLDLVTGLPSVGGTSIRILDRILEGGTYPFFSRLTADQRWDDGTEVWAEAQATSGASDIDNDDTQLDTLTRPAADWAVGSGRDLWIGLECVRATAAANQGTGARLTVTRGRYGIGVSNGYRHRVSSTERSWPILSTVPRTLVGRRIAIYRYAWRTPAWVRQGNEAEPGMEVAWPEASSQVVFRGLVRARTYEGDGTWRIDCDSMTALLDREIGWRLDRGSYLYGLDLRSASYRRWDVLISAYRLEVVTAYERARQTFSFGVGNVVTGADDAAILEALRFGVAEGLQAWLAANWRITYATNETTISVELRDFGWGPVLMAVVYWGTTGLTAGTDEVWLTFSSGMLSPLSIYGYGDPAASNNVIAPLDTASTTIAFANIAQTPPLVALWSYWTERASGIPGWDPNDRIYVKDNVPFFANQGDYPDSLRAFVRVKDYIVGINGKTSTNRLNTVTDSGPEAIPFMEFMQALTTGLEGRFYMGQRAGEDPVQVGQVFRPNPTTDVLKLTLGLMLSHGLANYATAGLASEYVGLDPFADGIGAAIDSEYIDLDSWWAVRGSLAWTATQQSLSLEEPMTLRSWLSSVLQPLGLYMCIDTSTWKFRLRRKRQPAAVESIYTITDSDRAPGSERAQVSMSTAHVITDWLVRYQRDPISGDYTREARLQNLQAQANTGLQRTVEIDCPWLQDIGDSIAWIRNYLQLQAGAWHDRAMPIVTVPLNRKAFRAFSAGDVVRLTASDIYDPLTGARGVTDMVCLCVDMTPDENKTTGKATLLTFPQRPPKTWVTTAIANRLAGALGGGLEARSAGVSATLVVLTTRYGTSEYDDFAIGDKVLIISPYADDPTVAATGWTAAILALPATNQIQVDNDLTSGGGYDTTGATEYWILDATYASALTSQRTDHAYIGDDADGLIDNSTTIDRYA